MEKIRERLPELPKDKEIILYCRLGFKGYLAYRILVQNGFSRVRNLSGGWLTYKPVFEEKKLMVAGQVDEKTTGYEASMASALSTVEPDNEAPVNRVKIDACGLQCPGPIVQVFEMMKKLKNGDLLEVSATDPGFVSDIKSWCENTGNQLLKVEKKGDNIEALIRKGRPERLFQRKRFLNNLYRVESKTPLSCSAGI